MSAMFSPGESNHEASAIHCSFFAAWLELLSFQTSSGQDLLGRRRHNGKVPQWLGRIRLELQVPQLPNFPCKA